MNKLIFLSDDSIALPLNIFRCHICSPQECTKAFKKCSSTKKDAPKLFFSCSQTTEALKKKAAAVNTLHS